MFKKISFPRFINWIIVLFVIQTNYSYKYWQDKDRIIAWDAISYYAYLPATFIYHDPSLEFADSAPEEVKAKIWYNKSPTGKRVIKTSCGLAFLFAPFFFGAHTYCLISGDAADGYSVPYSIGLIISSICYFAFGLYYLRKTLSLFFPNIVVISCCVVVAIGTNLFNYITAEPTMSHAYGFFLISAFIWFTIKWHQESSYKLSCILGILVGLITLTRPPNILIVLFFALYGVSTIADFKNRVISFLKEYKHFILIAIIAFAIWIPQLLYWKSMAGQWVYNSYGDSERFFFNDPKIISGLFSYRKGWLLYTPIMTFALIGIFFLREQLKTLFLPILLFVIINIYVLFSWWSWWYGGGFGARAMIDSYPLLVIPMGAFFSFVFKRGKVITLFMFLVLSALIYLNLFQSQQYRIGIIHWDSMSKRAYWANFGKMTAVPNYEELLEPIDYEKARKGDR